MKVHTLNSVATQTPYVGKFWFSSQNALNQPDCNILKSALSQEKLDESTWYEACRYRFKKRKRWFVNL